MRVIMTVEVIMTGRFEILDILSYFELNCRFGPFRQTRMS